jgi:hypothetical protein
MNVDRDMIAYGQGAAGRLHAIADSLRGVVTTYETLSSQAYYYQYGRWGRGGIDSNIPELTMKMTMTANSDESNRKKLWAIMDSLRAKIAVEMTEKYKLNFGAKK